MRVVTGFAYAGIFIVAESWINEASENGNRGKLMSCYMLVSLGGMAGGQMLLNSAHPSSFELFALVAIEAAGDIDTEDLQSSFEELVKAVESI